MKLLIGKWNTEKDFEDLTDLMLKIRPFDEVFDIRAHFEFKTPSYNFNQLVRRMRTQISPETERVLMLTDRPIEYQGAIAITPDLLREIGHTNRSILSIDKDKTLYVRGDVEPYIIAVSNEHFGIGACAVLENDYKKIVRDMAATLAGTFGISDHKECLVSSKSAFRREDLCTECVRKITQYEQPQEIPAYVSHLF